jgi:hypothetical protein
MNCPRGYLQREGVVTRSWCAVGWLLLMTSAGTAHGQAAAQAEILFNDGQQLMTEGKFAEACAAFDESQKLDFAISTLLNQAHCREKNGQLATAWGHFLQAERSTRGATDAPTQKFHKVALERANKLEPRLSKLRITVAPRNRIERLEILRNGDRIGEASWNLAVPVDGGTYTITARAPGAADWSATVIVAEASDVKTVDVPRLSRTESAVKPETGDEARPASIQESPPSQESATRVPIVIGIGSVALLGTGIGFELWARSRYRDAEREADDARQESLWKSANSKRHVALGLGGAAALTGGLALWLYLRSEVEEPSARSSGRVRVQPMVTGGRYGLWMHGDF